MYDMHVHTDTSHDCNQTIDQVCVSAVERGLTGIAICNHADMGPCDVPGSYEAMCRCAVQVEQARRKYDIDILQGIEMAEYVYDPEKGKKILDICNYDVILGSVHYVRYKDIDCAYSKVDFCAMPGEHIQGFMNEYFDRVAHMIQNTDFDILAHLTCPIRYINGKYKCGYDISPHKAQIYDILKEIISKNIALEINTSGIGCAHNDFMPDRNILQMYADMGGRLITTASDAHTPDRVGTAMDSATQLAKQCGINSYCYYKDRKPQFVKI